MNEGEQEPEDQTPVDVPLGDFKFGRLMEFSVLGDDKAQPTVVDLYSVIADAPLHVLRINDVDMLGTGYTLRMTWANEGGIKSGTAFSTILYSETIRIVQRARMQKLEAVTAEAA